MEDNHKKHHDKKHYHKKHHNVDTNKDKGTSSDKSNLGHENVKRFLKYVILAAKRQEDKKRAKKDLDRHVSKIKKLAVNKAEKDAIEDALAKLNSKLNDVLDKEGKLLVHDVKDGLASEEIKLRIYELENRLNEIGKYDIELINSLKQKIYVLESELSQEAYVNRQSVNTIKSSLDSVRGQLKDMMRQKDERDKKIEEIENKIKEKVISNHDEIVKIEEDIKRFEDKFEKLNGSGKYDKSILTEMSEKIYNLRQKLVMRKTGIGPAEEKIIKSKQGRIENISSSDKFLSDKGRSDAAKLGLPINEKDKSPADNVKLKKDPVKHDLNIEPFKDHVSSKPGELPPLPPLPPIGKEDKGFIGKIFKR